MRRAWTTEHQRREPTPLWVHAARAGASVVAAAGLSVACSSGNATPVRTVTVTEMPSPNFPSVPTETAPVYCGRGSQDSQPQLGIASDGHPIVAVRSECTGDPTAPSELDPTNEPWHAQNHYRARLPNGTKVEVMCSRVGNHTQDNEGVGNTTWYDVKVLDGQAANTVGTISSVLLGFPIFTSAVPSC